MAGFGNGTKTPFLNYVDKRQKDLEAEGFTFPTKADRKDLMDFVKRDWQKLSIHDKNSFRTVIPKSPTLKEVDPLSLKGRELQAEADDTKAMLAILKLLHPGPAEIPITEQVFIIIGATAYVQLSHSVHMPAEIGMVAFSLQNGIVDNFSALIDPGRIPNLHRSPPHQVAAQSKLLNVPIPPYSEACRDYNAIWLRMTRFMNFNRTTKSTTFLFCLRSQLGKVKNCLAIIQAKSDLKWEYEVFPLEMLLQRFEVVGREMFKAEQKRLELRQRVEQVMAQYCEHVEYPKIEHFGIANRIRRPVTLPEEHNELFRSEKLAADYLDSHYLRFFNAYESLECPHHMVNYTSSIECPLKLANLNAFRMIDYIIDYFGILPLEGAHYPLLDHVAEKNKRRRMVAIWGDFGHKGWKGFKDSCDNVQPPKPKQGLVHKSKGKGVAIAARKFLEAIASQLADGKRPEAPASQLADGKCPDAPASQLADGKCPDAPASQLTDGKCPEAPASQMANAKRPEVSATGAGKKQNPFLMRKI